MYEVATLFYLGLKKSPPNVELFSVESYQPFISNIKLPYLQ